MLMLMWRNEFATEHPVESLRNGLELRHHITEGFAMRETVPHGGVQLEYENPTIRQDIEIDAEKVELGVSANPLKSVGGVGSDIEFVVRDEYELLLPHPSIPDHQGLLRAAWPVDVPRFIYMADDRMDLAIDT